MTWVKICGITNLDDALMAVDAGADALGFVFYEKSPRYVSPETVREIVRTLPEGVEKVGVFVNEPGEKMRRTVQESDLTAVQCYCEHAKPSSIRNEICVESEQAPTKLIIARHAPKPNDTGSFGVGDAADLEAMYALLIDSGSTYSPGGTGTRFDWVAGYSWLRGMKKLIPTIVAGGLDSENVSAAMTLCQPWGVDVSTGVEASKGKKDPQKLRAFVKAVREADKAQ